MTRNRKAALMRIAGYALVALPFVAFFALMAAAVIQTIGIPALLICAAILASVVGSFIGGTALIDESRRNS